MKRFLKCKACNISTFMKNTISFILQNHQITPKGPQDNFWMEKFHSINTYSWIDNFEMSILKWYASLVSIRLEKTFFLNMCSTKNFFTFHQNDRCYIRHIFIFEISEIRGKRKPYMFHKSNLHIRVLKVLESFGTSFEIHISKKIAF